MNFCFISTMHGYSWGGSELLWAGAARLSAGEGHRVTVMTHPPDVEPPAVAELRALGARVLRRPRSDGRLARARERFLGNFAGLARDRPDLVVVSLGSAYDPINDIELNRFLEGSGRPYLVVCQHAPESRVLRRDFRERLLRFYRRARRVAFVAEGNRLALERQLVGSITGAVVVRNPLNLASLGALPWPGPDGPARIASVARLDASYKGQDVLFEVLAGDRWRSRDWRLGLHGEGPHREHLAELARFFGVDDRVVFAGQAADLRRVWLDNHLAVFPSRSEGTPLALVEAMACGRPAVVSDVGGNAEWVEEPRNGMIAEAPTARSFGLALERAWDARGRWEAMGSAAREDALAKIDPAPGRTLLGLMVEAAGRPAARRSAVAGGVA